MSKKRWFIVPVITGLLALTLTGGAIFAQNNAERRGEHRQQGVMTRVAEILELEESTVQDAFSQAHQEQHEAALQNKLDRMVANEKISQEQADDIWDWYLAKPDVDLPLERITFRSEKAVQRHIDRIVEAGWITQADADAVIEWHQGQPEIVSELSSNHRRSDRGSKGSGFGHGPTLGDNEATTESQFFDGASPNFRPQITDESLSY